MSNDSSNSITPRTKNDEQTINWRPIIAIIVAAIIFVVAQIFSGLVVLLYTTLKHWSYAVTKDWLNNSMTAQFVTTLVAYLTIVFLLWVFLRHKRRTFAVLGLLKPKLKDLGYALTGLAVYFPAYIVVVVILSQLIPGLNVNQTQQIGFQNAVGAGQLTMVFFSLVFLPPLVEELLFRGFLFTSLRSKLSFVWAGLITSALFAAPHLLEGGSGGLLWIAAIDTFVLSLVLVWLREKTGRLYAGMGLHGLKNFIAFFVLFIAPHIHWHSLSF